MVALNFPSTGLVANVTTYTVGSKTWIWNGVSWDSVVEASSIDSSILGSGTADDSTYLRGDRTWSAVSSMVYPTTGVAVSTGSAWNTSKIAPTGDFVGTTDTQTLTNKTLEATSLTNGYTEEVYAVSGTTPALSPINGSIQTWTLSGNSTPTAGTWGSGQSITLMIDDGSAYSVTWTSLAVTWKTDGGLPPTLNTSGYTVIALWKVGSTVYGARVGDA